MTTNVFPYDGEVGFEGIWTAITAARAFDRSLIDVPQPATHWQRYTTGGTAALKINEVLTGQSGGATLRLIAQAVENGTAGSSDSGILFVQIISGTTQAETLLGGTSMGTVAVAQAFLPIRYYTSPKTCLFAVETAAINFTISGVDPTATAGTNYGSQISTGGSYVLRGYQNIRNFKAINAANASGAILKYTLFY